MTLDGKPFKSFKTLDGLIIKEGDFVSFETINQEEVEGTILSMNSKGITIKEDEVLYSQVWSYLDITEGTIQTI